MNNALVIPSAFPPSSTLLLLVLLAASASPLSAAPAVRIAAREELELAESKVTRRTTSGRAARDATLPASVTWTRTEPGTTVVDNAGSVLWRNKGVAALGVGGYLAVTQPGQVMDGLAEIIHGPVPPSTDAGSTDTSTKTSAAQITSTTVIGWLVQSVGPYALMFTAGAIVVPLLRYLFRPRNR
ncbi:MAG: hypothetical protein IT462_14490 [Planctomycetes bacterium]|nr:hypothetical protein [Planctomycetota bacterium]